MSFAELIDEIPQIKKSSLKEQDDWESYFNEHKTKILEFKEKTDKIEKEVNTVVYRIYRLNNDEIKIVEENYPDN